MKRKKYIYKVGHAGVSSTTDFTSIWEAVRYIVHCIHNQTFGRDAITIWRTEA